MRFARRTFLASLAALAALRAAAAQADARPGVPITLPRDFGAHPEFRIEWPSAKRVICRASPPKAGMTQT